MKSLVQNKNLAAEINIRELLILLPHSMTPGMDLMTEVREERKDKHRHRHNDMQKSWKWVD